VYRIDENENISDISQRKYSQYRVLAEEKCKSTNLIISGLVVGIEDEAFRLTYFAFFIKTNLDGLS